MTLHRFVVDVLDNSGNVVGEGPLNNVLSVAVTEELDRAGKVEITVPASERAIELVQNEYQIRPRSIDGLAATGIIQNFDVIVQNNKPVFRLSGPDKLGELIYLNTGYNRLYDDANIASAIIGTHATPTSLLGGTNWTQGTVSPSIYTTSTIKYDAQTILQALIALAEQCDDHFRQGSTEQTLDWGAFGTDSGVRITNLPHVLQVNAEAQENLAYVSGVTVQNISADIENRLFPVGKNRFDLRDATSASANVKVAASKGPTGATTTVAATVTASDTTVTVTDATGFAVDQELWIGDADDWTQDHEVAIITNVAGNVITILNASGFENGYAIGRDVIQNPQFYVEDTSSQSTYGVREACPQFGWIGPVDLSANSAQQQQAADTLYAAANARLTRYASAYQNYKLGVVLNLPSDLRVGEKVRLVYRGAAQVYGGGTLFLDINDDFYVLRITRLWRGTGEKTATLDVVNTTRPTPSNENLVLYNLDMLRWVGLG